MVDVLLACQLATHGRQFNPSHLKGFVYCNLFRICQDAVQAIIGKSMGDAFGCAAEQGARQRFQKVSCRGAQHETRDQNFSHSMQICMSVSMFNNDVLNGRQPAIVLTIPR
jgi:hypothetical protein